MFANEISLIKKNIRILISYFPEKDFTIINLVIAHAQFIFIHFIYPYYSQPLIIPKKSC